MSDSLLRFFFKCLFSSKLTVQASMMLCHPDAKKYRTNFKAHKEELTTVLYKMYNEKIFESKLDIDIIWNKKLTTTAGRFHGRTKYNRNINGQTMVVFNTFSISFIGQSN